MVTEQSTAPTVEPITAAQAKAHMRVDTTDDDTLIGYQIIAARQYIESFTGRQLCTATWRLYLDEWPDDVMTLPYPPLQSVSSITYVDADGDTQTLSTSVYTVDAVSVPARIYLAYSQTWPSTRGIRNQICVTFVSGYGDADSVPDDIKAACKLITADLYENRQKQIVEKLYANETADRILWPHRVFIEGF